MEESRVETRLVRDEGSNELLNAATTTFYTF